MRASFLRCRLTEWKNVIYSLPLLKWITGKDLYSCGCAVAQAWHAELCVMFVASHTCVGVLRRFGLTDFSDINIFLVQLQ